MLESPIKWAGGKRWLVRAGNIPTPSDYRAYFEPFLGGASLFFSLGPNAGTISDKNEELIHLYRALRVYPRQLYRRLKQHQERHNGAYYYTVRGRTPTDAVERAARFLYLNRACWNGLYRVNKCGRFNVPKGSRDKIVFDSDDFVALACALRRVRICCSDFEDVVGEAGLGDFVFADPPYTVKHSNNGFLRYNEDLFSWEDQERLSDVLHRAASRGCFVTVTNADHDSVRRLYRKAEYKRIGRVSRMAGDIRMRGKVTEALFTFNL